MVIIPQTNCQVQEPANQKNKKKNKTSGSYGLFAAIMAIHLVDSQNSRFALQNANSLGEKDGQQC